MPVEARLCLSCLLTAAAAADGLYAVASPLPAAQATDSTHPELLHPDFAGWKEEGPSNGSSPPVGGSS
jgi:hypothetical protein